MSTISVQTTLDIKENEFSPSFSLSESLAKKLKTALLKYRRMEEKEKKRQQEGFFELVPTKFMKYKIKFDSHVGFVKLPSENPSALIIHPKFNVDIWGMINFVFKSKFKVNFEELIKSEPTEDINLVILRLFVDQLSELWNNLKRYQYQEMTGHLKDIKGNVDLFKTYINIFQLKPDICCYYEEFTLDQPFNQVLRFTLSLIRPQINLHPYYKKKLGLKVRRLWDDMTMVTNRQFTIDEINRFEYNHLNQQYYPLHQLAKIIIHNGFVTPQEGGFFLFGFLINTWNLFEEFFHSLFKRFLPKEIECSYQEKFKLKTRPDLRPQSFDFVLKTSDWWTICDAKYKIQPKYSDYYQMSDYCANIREKQYVKAPIIPEKVVYVFLYPLTEKSKQEYDVEDRGHYDVIHAPIRLSKKYLRNEIYLKEYLEKLLEAIKEKAQADEIKKSRRANRPN